MHPILVMTSLIFSLFFTTHSSATEEAQFKKYTGLQKGRNSVTEDEASKLYQNTIANPVASLDNLSKYDPTGIIGFCYGRAMTAQLYARKVGLAEASIKKLFIIGAMCANKKCKPEQPEWRFHVTTIVKGQRNWYAIDPIVYNGGKYVPLTVNAWIEKVRKTYDTFHPPPYRTLLYVTPVETIMPDIRILDTPEKGDKIIELNFKPEDHGIAADPETNTLLNVDPEISLYHLNQALSQKYFLTLDGEQENRFSFLDIKVNDEIYPYNNYFVDLFLSFEGNPQEQRMTMSRAQNPLSFSPKDDLDLGSFRISEVLKKK